MSTHSISYSRAFGLTNQHGPTGTIPEALQDGLDCHDREDQWQQHYTRSRNRPWSMVVLTMVDTSDFDVYSPHCVLVIGYLRSWSPHPIYSSIHAGYKYKVQNTKTEKHRNSNATSRNHNRNRVTITTPSNPEPSNLVLRLTDIQSRRYRPHHCTDDPTPLETLPVRPPRRPGFPKYDIPQLRLALGRRALSPRARDDAAGTP